MIIITIRVKNIDSSLNKAFSELKAFHEDKAGGFYMDDIVSKDDNKSVDETIKEALCLIEKKSELFMKVYQSGGETELYITYRQKDGAPLIFSAKTLEFLSLYGISLGID